MLKPYLFLNIAILVLALASCKTTKNNGDNMRNTAPEVKYIEGTSALLGEGSIWDDSKEILYWIDIQGELLMEYDPATGTNTAYELFQNVGTVVPESQNTVIVALRDGIYRKFFSPDSLEFIGRPASLKEEERFNDGKCDSNGRLWVGTIRTKGRLGDSWLYKYDPAEGFTEMIDSISISNGIIWSLDNTKMYYIDTPTRTIMQYDFDSASGTISNGYPAVEIPDSLGSPDGMTIDEEGKLWVGMWGGHAVCRFDPETGQLIDRIEVPARNVTSCAFGGENFETLYITTASVGMNEEQKEKFPLAGGLFEVKPGVKGVKANFYSE